jgi:hypothetical protein
MAITEAFTKFVELDVAYVNARLKVHETTRQVAAGLLPAQAARYVIRAPELQTR